ncbi:hypothetical protein B621_gp38 [Marinomonas phage P12026]|uniref:hypothetical protein n=1 Tax=Marinomonas phage P12026 TaxID=1176423 RepID=UPI0002688F50|nr:hypothetical protein B621_gp38 [Marinomonas phage P12026]AFM54884.1 hypothetical protein P12026_38 [Marinomonas phage P12026]
MNNINPYSHQPSDSNRAKGAAMAEAITEIFQTLRAYYPKCNIVMKTEKQELSMMREWGVALAKANIDREMLKNGIERAKSYAAEDSFCNWPSLGNFISWCHGIPSPEAAYMETARKCHDLTEWEPTHPIVALAGREVTFVAIRHNEDKKAYKAEYIRIYCELCLRVCNGETLTYTKPEKPKMLEQKPQTEREKAENLEALAELKAMIGKTEPEKKECLSLTEQEKKKTLAEMKIRLEKWQASKGEK